MLAGCGSAPQKNEPFNGVTEQTQQRVDAWRKLIEDGHNWPANKQLNATNDFINQMNFVDDIVHWGEEDYWATPLQTIVTQGGDCEDFAVAKYFTLTEMGMSSSKLRLTYVKALSLNQAHMVVSYYPGTEADPLVLDNLNPVIRPASQRDDLLAVYSFNLDSLWLDKQGESHYLDDSSRLSLWQGLLASINAEANNTDTMICRYQHYDLPDNKIQGLCR